MYIWCDDDSVAELNPRNLETFGGLASAGSRHRVALDKAAGFRVSTVFLQIDHQFAGGPPILWETMVFHDDDDDWADLFCKRYETLEQARAGHAQVLAALTGGTPADDLHKVLQS